MTEKQEKISKLKNDQRRSTEAAKLPDKQAAKRKINYQAVIYTDGSCLRNPGGRGGYGCVIIYNELCQEFSGGFRRTTNNRMEIMSAIVAFRELREKKCRVQLFSDSQYLINGMKKGWAKGWRRNNWMRTKKQQASNADLWDELLRVSAMHRVTYTWIKGHSGNMQHNRCDRLASQAARGPVLAIDHGYGKKFHPLSSELPATQVAVNGNSLVPEPV